MTETPPDSHQARHGRLERLLQGAFGAARLRHQLAMVDIEAKHRLALYHSHFNPTQPRVPAGHPDGGQWTRDGSSELGAHTLSDATPDHDWLPNAQYASGRGRGTVPVRIGGQWVEMEPARAQTALRRIREVDPTWRPREASYYGEGAESEIRKANDLADQAEAQLREFGEFPPIILRERPPTAKERNDVAREIARWLIKNLGRVVEGEGWLDEYEASINAYLDPPKTLEELQRDASTPKKGYDVHHIVEQTPAENDGFPRSMIDGLDNRVRISRFKHWEINSWYGRPNPAFGGSSPREYLRGTGWDERLRVGLEALAKYGVLKP
jgi:hypothetical protein